MPVLIFQGHQLGQAFAAAEKISAERRDHEDQPAPGQDRQRVDEGSALGVGDPVLCEKLFELVDQQGKPRGGLALKLFLPHAVGGGLRQPALDQRGNASRFHAEHGC